MGPKPRASEFRFYEELNAFLEPRLRRRCFEHAYDGTPSVKDRIEALGVPHTEVDLILVDGRSVDFSHRLVGGERVAVYPVFERLDISETTRLRSRPLRDPRFHLDVHLGRLAAYLRLLGFDCRYHNRAEDAVIIETARAEHRIVLTRDLGLLKDSRVTHGAFIHATAPMEQLTEVVGRFQLENLMRPWTRCMKCNGEVVPLRKSEIDKTRVPAGVLTQHEIFSQCRTCGRIFWPGSHYEAMRRHLGQVGIDIHRD